jgi:energy-coupling factor transport system permease protein
MNPLLFPYQDKDSRTHRLDARPKIVFVVTIFLLSILISDIFYLAVLLTFVLCVAAVARVLRPTFSLLKYTLYVAAFIFLFSILFTVSATTTIWAQLGPVQVKAEAVLFATSMALRLFLATSAFCVLTFTVHPDRLLQVLSKFGYKSMTGLSLATRMYPTIAADSAGIEDAMKARGVEFDAGGMVQKVKARAPVMMPLLLNSMDRSMEIAEAMEARGFGAGKRSRYFDTPLTTASKITIAMTLAALPFGIIMFILGFGNGDYLNGVKFSITLADVAVVAIYLTLFSPILWGAGRR